jgi:hypothetical protein
MTPERLRVAAELLGVLLPIGAGLRLAVRA